MTTELHASSETSKLSNVKNKRLFVSVYRYDPDQDQAPRMQDYEIDSIEFHGVMILDVLEALKIKDPTLTFRRSCSEGVCGSDGMNINGKNGLACVTSFLRLSTDKIVLRPLSGLPVIRDLVVDMSRFYKQYERTQPYLQNSDPPPQTERRQTIEQRKKLDGLYECILCACCTSSCPSYWWNPEKFLGPAALLTAYRFIADSRDDQKQERLNELQDPFSVFRCRTIMNCADVCPKELNPSQAIAHIRDEMLKESV